MTDDQCARVITWSGGTNTIFNLNHPWVRSVVDFRGIAGPGDTPAACLARFSADAYSIGDVERILELGLFGGGMPENEVDQILDQHIHGNPALDKLGKPRVKVYLNPFKDQSGEINAREPGGTLAVRVPATLKRAVEQAAKQAGVSGNVWTMRCLERGIYDAEAIQLLGTIAATFQYLEDEDHRLTSGDRIRIGRTTTESLEYFVKRRFPDVPLEELRAHIIDQWDEELESHVSGQPLD